MITLYDNPFSPFTRKVRMVLRYKQIEFRSIDALALAEQEGLGRFNPRREVPVLVEGDLVVADSADIVAYLEDRHPSPSVLPGAPSSRARARSWQRIADTVLDAVVHDSSLWMWPTHRRSDTPPTGLIEAGQRDLSAILGRLERDLGNGRFVCDELSIADIALFPHVSSLKPLGIVLDPTRHPKLCEWNQKLRQQSFVKADLDYVRRAAVEKFAGGSSPYEPEKVVWRGDRLEWLLHHGFLDWWACEWNAGRAVVPSSV